MHNQFKPPMTLRIRAFYDNHLRIFETAIIGVLCISFFIAGFYLGSRKVADLQAVLNDARIDNAFVWSMLDAKDEFGTRQYVNVTHKKACQVCRDFLVKRDHDAYNEIHDQYQAAHRTHVRANLQKAVR